MITFPSPRVTLGIFEEPSSFVDPAVVHCARVPCVGEFIEGYGSTIMLVTRVVHHISGRQADVEVNAEGVGLDATVWVISEERAAITGLLP